MSEFKQYTTGEMLDLMVHLSDGSAFVCVEGPKAMSGVAVGTVIVKDKGTLTIRETLGSRTSYASIMLTLDLLQCKWEMEPYEINEEDFLACFARGDVIEIRAKGYGPVRISSQQEVIKLTPAHLISGKFYIAREAAKK